MADLRALIEARDRGEVRAALVSEMTGDLTRVLSKCGLRPEPSLLIEHGHESALAILTELLWKDMAYETECMPKKQAESIAQSLFGKYSDSNSRFYSNGNWALRESWNPLTDATFDAGLIIASSNKNYFCIWFEDED